LISFISGLLLAIADPRICEGFGPGPPTHHQDESGILLKLAQLHGLVTVRVAEFGVALLNLGDLLFLGKLAILHSLLLSALLSHHQ
jgi:hypothetical protein